MPLDRKALLRKIADASASGGGNNILDGRGRIAIRKLSIEDGFNGSRFVLEGVVVSSAKIPVVELLTGKTLDVAPNAPNTDVSWVQMLDKHESAFGAVKGLILALYGVAETETSNEELVETLDEVTAKNTAHGMVIDYSTFRKVTRENKKEIVVVKWANVEQTADDIKQYKAWLDSIVASPKPEATA